MTVNVSLCGSIPRSQMNFGSNKRLRELSVNSNNLHPNRKKLKTLPPSGEVERMNLPRQVSCETINTQAPPPTIEPPSWAVAAKGDAKLEPLGESSLLQSTVDLTTQAVFNIGRSQNSDVQLLHCTSSRRHAILFHHPNGNCYVVDCGSAHGTYVNGERVKTVPSENNDPSSTGGGVIFPHRVKKGALIRFGGPGAPTFILKSFPLGMKALMLSLGELKKTTICTNASNPNQNIQCVDDDDLGARVFSVDELVILNTRLNAIGSSANSLPPSKRDAQCTSARLKAQLLPEMKPSNVGFLKKRSIVSFDEESDVESESRKLKFTPTTDDDEAQTDFYESPDIAIVSPSRQKQTLVFNFEEADRPVVSPTPLLDETQGLVLSSDIKSILVAPLALPSSRKKNCRVSFCDRPPKVFYPASVTPDSTSDSEH